MKRVVRWIGAGILAASVMTMVLADIALAGGMTDHAAGAAVLPGQTR